MKIKPSDIYPGYDRRVDGMFFQHSGATKIARVWRYPTGSPSRQFSFWNGFIRDADIRWQSFDVARQTSWEGQSGAFPITTYCMPDTHAPYDAGIVDLAKRSFVSTNAWVRLAGYPWMDDPVTPYALPDSDGISITNVLDGSIPDYPLAKPVQFTWSRAGFDPALSALGHVYVSVSYSVPVSARWSPHWRYVGTMFTAPSFPVTITDLLDTCGRIVFNATIGIRVVLQDIGSPVTSPSFPLPNYAFAAGEGYFRNSEF